MHGTSYISRTGYRGRLFVGEREPRRETAETPATVPKQQG